MITQLVQPGDSSLASGTAQATTRHLSNCDWSADALDSLDQARSDTEAYRNRFSMQGGSSNLSVDEHKSRAKESFARLQVMLKTLLHRAMLMSFIGTRVC